MVVAQLLCGPMRLLLGPGELSHAPFGALFSLDNILKFLDGEAILEVVVGGVFLHDILGYGGFFQSLHQGVHYHLVHVGGFAHR